MSRDAAAAAAAAQRLADLRVDQRAKEAVVPAKEAEHQQVANVQGRAFRKHAGAGSVDVALNEAEHQQFANARPGSGGGCCLGGGWLGQRLHAADAA